MQTIKTIDEQFYSMLGKQIRRAREHRNMTQLELSKKIGCSRPLLTAYENGYSKISASKWNRICEALSIQNGLEIDVKIGQKYARYY